MAVLSVERAVVVLPVERVVVVLSVEDVSVGTFRGNRGGTAGGRYGGSFGCRRTSGVVNLPPSESSCARRDSEHRK